MQLGELNAASTFRIKSEIVCLTFLGSMSESPLFHSFVRKKCINATIRRFAKRLVSEAFSFLQAGKKFIKINLEKKAKIRCTPQLWKKSSFKLGKHTNIRILRFMLIYIFKISFDVCFLKEFVVTIRNET